MPVCVLECAQAVAPPAHKAFPGKQSTWNGFDRHDFQFDGRHCIVVAPKQVGPDRPWIWRARFFGHEPQTDVALLQLGFHLVYCDVANLFGSPQAVGHWNAFYKYLTEEHGLARRAALEGMSRGGLIVYNWAAANPDKVACIYADAPVCDIKSWPGGKGRGKGSAAAWQACLQAYQLTEEQVPRFTGNPTDNLQPLAKAGVPLLHIVGAADQVVPVDENTAILAERYRQLGGSIRVISKPGVGHHPHSLKDPKPIVQFITRHTARPRSL
jgi:pimeloyl-ACP methyl ester carboxylesterase